MDKDNNNIKPFISGSGTLECLDHAAAIMLCLGDLLSANDKKIRVTIERDPESGRFVIERNVCS